MIRSTNTIAKALSKKIQQEQNLSGKLTSVQLSKTKMRTPNTGRQKAFSNFCILYLVCKDRPSSSTKRFRPDLIKLEHRRREAKEAHADGFHCRVSELGGLASGSHHVTAM
jgi:hypothetical protein